MLKRLIEVALPLKEVSEQSAREKSIRQGHISTLHVWWARRPSATCRAAVFASLIPDPDDPECPKSFQKLVSDILGRSEFTPKSDEGHCIEDTPRHRCLEFIKRLVRWENSNNPDYCEPARKLIAAAHGILAPNSGEGRPSVLDPFAGGGAIPLEALRLGCEAHANDLNPVAHLIELCTLVFPQGYGQPSSSPVPEYIRRLATRSKRQGRSATPLFHAEDDVASDSITDADSLDVEISEAEYRKNPLAADVKYWGAWVLANVRQDLGKYYPADPDGGLPMAYLWARIVRCSNPACSCDIPLVTNLWLINKPRMKVALRLRLSKSHHTVAFDIAEGEDIDFDPDEGTIQRGNVACPACKQVSASDYLRQECKLGRMGQQMIGVVLGASSGKTLRFRAVTDSDQRIFEQATEALSGVANDIPDEDISTRQPRLMWVTTYGLTKWRDLFNARQLVALARFVHWLRVAGERISEAHDEGYAAVLTTYHAMAIGRLCSYNSSLCRWGQEFIGNTFGRQGLPMVWNYCEAVPIGISSGNWEGAIDSICRVIRELSPSSTQVGQTYQGSATKLPYGNGCISAIVTDPPYYDAVPYSDLSDFFYVWHKRSIGDRYPNQFRTPLTPKRQELIEERSHSSLKNRKDKRFYEDGIAEAFVEICRVLADDSVCCVMFAHKTTTAWETLIEGLLKARLVVTASWPFHTERTGRLIARGTASLASSVTLVCRKRADRAGSGLWDDVRRELQKVAKERLEFFWAQDIRGADFFISAIGPSLSVFGKYERVTKLSGEEVTVGQFLDEVRSLVTSYALAKILKTARTAIIDPESRFYVLWKWSYGDVKVPADESFKLAQALGMGTDTMWDRTGVLEKSGENVSMVPVAKRMKIKDLGEPNADGTPASLIDVLHRLCVFREKGDTSGMAEFLARSGQGQNPTLWLVAQAVSEILPEGEKEKQLMQGLLNQKDQLEQAGQGRLF